MPTREAVPVSRNEAPTVMIINPLHPHRGEIFDRYACIRSGSVIVHRLCGPASELPSDEVYWFGPEAQGEADEIQKRFFANQEELTALWMLWRDAKVPKVSETSRRAFMTCLTGAPVID